MLLSLGFCSPSSAVSTPFIRSGRFVIVWSHFTSYYHVSQRDQSQQIFCFLMFRKVLSHLPEYDQFASSSRYDLFVQLRRMQDLSHLPYPSCLGQDLQNSSKSSKKNLFWISDSLRSSLRVINSESDCFKPSSLSSSQKLSNHIPVLVNLFNAGSSPWR